jgi:hypothetical protein
MRKTMLVFLVLLAAGCGEKTGPVTVTPQMEAEMKQKEQAVHEAESAMQKQRPITMTREQKVQSAEAAESARQRSAAGR